ncbi:hypothetical protein NC653_013238 [Populus alba x Populus x berolinensis]|uniref:Uncharacterized protein n=1 Tax=Populus alba x Populus x berolinensis TaxID=444605 RepID=A0AAD6W2S0_9ROSI|nr:hypothetical protein NC653_013238 [Populus alba x Populus x berolinensis]
MLINHHCKEAGNVGTTSVKLIMLSFLVSRLSPPSGIVFGFKT